MQYPGGKWLLADWIIEHFPPHKVYVEPFGGGASVLLKKQRASHAEFYNDVDGDIVNLFRVLRDRDTANELIKMLELTPFAKDEFDLAFVMDPEDTGIERARKMIIRSYFGFGASGPGTTNTGFRNKSLRQNSPYSKIWRNYPFRIPAIVDRLQGVTIDNRDALKMIEHLDSEDTLFYLDPPYVFDTRSNNASFYKHEMTDGQHQELLDLIIGLKGVVILSGYAHPIYDKYLSGWNRTDRAFYASSQGGRSNRIECLWLSPNIENKQMKLF